MKEIKVFGLEDYETSERGVAKAVSELKKQGWIVNRIERKSRDPAFCRGPDYFYDVLPFSDDYSSPVPAYIICYREIQ